MATCEDPSRSRIRPARVLLVDDHPLFCFGLAALLEREADLEVVGHAAAVHEALDLDARVAADLLIVDVLLRGGNGIELARNLRARRDARILGLSVVDVPIRIAAMLRAGAQGFALKIQSHGEILEAVRATLAGRCYLAPMIRDQVQQLVANDSRHPLESLTQRERQVFALLVAGENNASIGRQMGIAARTVDTHRQHILMKLGVHSVAELVRLAALWGELAR